MRLFKDRVEFSSNLNIRRVKKLISDKDLKVLQCSEPVNLSVWKILNNHFFTKRPEVQLRVYGFYSKVCNLEFTSILTNVKHFSADCLMDAVGMDNIAEMKQLESLGIGIYNLQDFNFLVQVTPRLQKIFLGRTRSKKPNLSPLSRFHDLREIYLEGQQKNIEIISQLQMLEDVTLRSVSTPDLSYLRPLSRMWSLDIKLGGIKNLSALRDMENIKYLELWQIRGLSNIDFISSLSGLQYLFLQSLPQVRQLPSMNGLKKLRRIHLDNMKGLIDLSTLAHAPALEEFTHINAKKMQPDDYLPLLRNPYLKNAFVGFSSLKNHIRFRELLKEHKVDLFQGGNEFKFT